MTGSRISRSLVVAIALFAVVASPTNAWAIVIVGGKTGLFGVTAGQTVRISILNAQSKGGITPCSKVFDMSGNLLAEVDTLMSLRPGEGTFVDFDAAMFGLREGQRMQLRVEVKLEGSNPPGDTSPVGGNPPDDGRPAQADDVILTLEVFDNATGRTTFTMPWVLAGFNPQPEPPAR